MTKSLGRFAPVAVLSLAFLAIEGLLRLALLVRVWVQLRPPPTELAAIFAAGACYDVVALLGPAALFALYLAAVPARFHAGPLGRALVHAGAVAALFAAFVSATAEWLFWSEFRSRFNFIAVDYLVYTREVLGNIWESYPVVPVLGVLLAGALLAWLALRRALAAACRAPVSGRARLLAAACVPLCGARARLRRRTPRAGLRRTLRGAARRERPIRAVLRVPPQRPRLPDLLHLAERRRRAAAGPHAALGSGARAS